MRFLIFCFLFLSSISYSSSLILPTGQFEFESVQKLASKHYVQSNLRFESHRMEYEALKAKGYYCGKRGLNIGVCSKRVEISELPKNLNIDRLKSLAPQFSLQNTYETTNESDLMNTYLVKQDHQIGDEGRFSYQAFENHGGELYLDLEFQEKKLRFSFFAPGHLTHTFLQRERLNRREHLVHTYLVQYNKN